MTRKERKENKRNEDYVRMEKKGRKRKRRN